jgi:thiol-disulfide isomerase/thioredoxin
MKRIIRPLAIFFPMVISILSWAQQPVSITGTSKRSRPAELKLFSVKEGRLLLVNKSKPDEKGQFGFSFLPPIEGFYAIGTGPESMPLDNYVFYFKPGDQLSLVIEDSTYHLTGAVNTPENKALEQWFTALYPVMRKSLYLLFTRSTYEEFFGQFNSLQPRLEEQRTHLKTGNPLFDNLGKKYMEAEEAFIAVNFLNFQRAGLPEPGAPLPDYLNKLDIGKFTATATLFKFPYGMYMLNTFLNYAVKYQSATGPRNAEAQFDYKMQLVRNDTLKGGTALKRLEETTSYESYMELFGRAGKYLVTADQQQKAQERKTWLEKWRPGAPGYNFTYADPSGKEFSFAGFKGKVVLVDMWATWCGPCKAEIPHLKKLEEEMKGTETVFVSISVDEEKNVGKWKQFVADQQLGGVQLNTNGKRDMTAFYEINGIPRFLLFDKNGKLISHNAPRPSNPELKKMMQAHL